MSTETIGMRLFWVELAIIWASLSLFMMFVFPFLLDYLIGPMPAEAARVKHGTLSSLPWFWYVLMAILPGKLAVLVAAYRDKYRVYKSTWRGRA